ncbi:MAG TPA: heparan-alpha-glucosaminide N-acetyltransferase domain-containing protein [Polyangiales bacterium]|nr:heparan-alpha-glucosaminide N-acetyltransferase domain-containing protein [Polyangiales bacterium]
MSTKAQATSRLASIDVLRGVGVVLMVQLHTSHGWISADARTGGSWSASQFWGGLAAPIFLMLAGVSLGLRWSGVLARGEQPRLGGDLRRALSLVVFGYLLRLQMWFIDAGGWARPDAYLAQASLAAAYAVALLTLSRANTLLPRAAGFAGASLLFAFGLWQTAAHAPDRLPGVLRVDVLQCIGGSLALAVGFATWTRDLPYFVGPRLSRASQTALRALKGDLPFLRRATRPGKRGPARSSDEIGQIPSLTRARAGFAIAACALAFVTVWTRTWVPGPLPVAIAAYLGQWPPAPGKSVLGLFPLFPWAAYTFAGVAFGLHWGQQRAGLLQRMVLLGAVALVIALATRESGTLAHRVLDPWPWLTQPLRVLQRVAWVLALTGACAALSAWLPAIVAPLDTLGRASLLVYWVHLEFAFGAASSGFAKSLGITPWAVGTAGLVVAMWLVAQIRVGLSPGRSRDPVGTIDESSLPRERTTSA